MTTTRFPLGSPDLGTKTLTEHVLESFGVSVPLTQFHGIQSRSAVDEGFDDKGLGVENRHGTSLMTTNGRPLLKAHPYISTR